MRRVIGLCGLVLLLGICYLSFYQAAPSDLGFSGERAFALGMVALTAVVMLLGIIFGCLYRRLTKSSGRVRILTEIKEMLNSSSFLSSLCVAPFVFFAVYAIVKQRPGDPASLLLAFENGFFCENIFHKMFPGDVPAPLGAAPADPKASEIPQ